MATGLGQPYVDRRDATVACRRRIRRGACLYHASVPFHSLYVVRAGSFKISIVTEDGREQVTGVYLPGEVLGVDGIGDDAYPSHAVALEDSEVREMPFARLEFASRRAPAVQRQIYRMMSGEIQRDHGMLLLSSMRADERLAAFLLNLSRRFQARGYSAIRFILRMAREEIGA